MMTPCFTQPLYLRIHFDCTADGIAPRPRNPNTTLKTHFAKATARWGDHFEMVAPIRILNFSPSLPYETMPHALAFHAGLERQHSRSRHSSFHMLVASLPLPLSLPYGADKTDLTSNSIHYFFHDRFGSTTNLPSWLLPPTEQNNNSLMPHSTPSLFRVESLPGLSHHPSFRKILKSHDRYTRSPLRTYIHNIGTISMTL